MSETSKRCSRCGEPIQAVAARVAIESGPLHATHPALELCVNCSDSLERWLARRGRGRSGGFSSHSQSHSHSHRHDGYGQPALSATPALWLDGERTRQLVIAMIFLAACVVGAILVMSVPG